jgi:hypothetical protein
MKLGEKLGNSRRGKPPWNKVRKGVQVPWNKGIPQSDLGHNSSKTITTSPVSDSWTSVLNAIGFLNDNSTFKISEYGNFVANFRQAPSPIPPEFLLALYGIIVSSIVGWSIPSIFGWIKAKREQARVHRYHTQINYLYADGGLDENDIGSLVNSKEKQLMHIRKER